MTITDTSAAGAAAVEPVKVLELEITRTCPLKCLHCYNNSGPFAPMGAMTVQDWMRAICTAADLGMDRVQLIGGEPTVHPHFEDLARYAITCGLKADVYTNLAQVPGKLWDLYEHPSIALMVSWYSDDPEQHDEITRTPGSYAATLANIRQAVSRGLPIKIGIVGEIIPGQRADQARAQMEEIGVTRVSYDHMRPIGRASRGVLPELTDLCGRCGNGIASILTDGDLVPCVMGRHLKVGNVRETPLEQLLGSLDWAEILANIPRPADACVSGGCGPTDSDGCDPSK